MSGPESPRGVGSLALVLFVTLLVAPTACETEPCPEREGFLLCGYCDEDALLSSNPHAGKCRYCPDGSTCGDPCTMTDCAGGSGGGDCGDWAIRCGEEIDGVIVVGGPVPEACPCPTGTHQTAVDNVTPGGPYRICSCD